MYTLAVGPMEAHTITATERPTIAVSRGEGMLRKVAAISWDFYIPVTVTLYHLTEISEQHSACYSHLYTSEQNSKSRHCISLSNLVESQVNWLCSLEMTNLWTWHDPRNSKSILMSYSIGDCCSIDRLVVRSSQILRHNCDDKGTDMKKGSFSISSVPNH